MIATKNCYSSWRILQKREERREKREETKTISLFMLTYINLVVVENDSDYSS